MARWPTDKVNPKPMRGIGWVGVWNEKKNRLGWAMPTHVDGYMADIQQKDFVQGARVYLCRITITPWRDKRGRMRSKIVPREQRYA